MPGTETQDAVSVVMPVHNALPHLDRAIESILAQTHRNFELVIYDDGSTDGSTERLREWAERDDRIRLFEAKRNLGPPGSSNAVVRHSRYPIIARMDADDLSHPDRLQIQLDLLRDNPDVGLVGSLCDTINGNGEKLRGPDLWRATRKSWFAPFPHGSIMYRREIFDRIGGYREECAFWEDQDLILRMASVTKILVIPKPLYMHRHSRTSTRLASDQERVERSVDLMYRAAERLNHGRSYDDLLLRSSKRPVGEKVDPRAFVSLGSLVLWAGGRPKLFGRLIERGRLGFNAATAGAMLWTVWASAAPGSLRGFMGLVARLRNRSARNRWGEDKARLWALPARTPVPDPESPTEVHGDSPIAAVRRMS